MWLKEKRLLLEKKMLLMQRFRTTSLYPLNKKALSVLLAEDPIWKLNVQGKEYVFNTPVISVRDAVVKAGLNPDQAWFIFFKVQGQPKVRKPLMIILT